MHKPACTCKKDLCFFDWHTRLSFRESTGPQLPPPPPPPTPLQLPPPRSKLVYCTGRCSCTTHTQLLFWPHLPLHKTPRGRSPHTTNQTPCSTPRTQCCSSHVDRCHHSNTIVHTTSPHTSPCCGRPTHTQPRAFPCFGRPGTQPPPTPKDNGHNQPGPGKHHMAGPKKQHNAPVRAAQHTPVS